MGPFGTIERPWKPFNPILGETFEVHKEGGRVRYIAEQVWAGEGGGGWGACTRFGVSLCVWVRGEGVGENVVVEWRDPACVRACGTARRPQVTHHPPTCMAHTPLSQAHGPYF